MNQEVYSTHQNRWPWLHMKTAVLGMILEANNHGIYSLSLREIQQVTGCNYRSIKTKIPQWVRKGHLRCIKPKDKSRYCSYTLTPSGYDLLPIYDEGWYDIRKGKFYRVPVADVLARLPGLKALKATLS